MTAESVPAITLTGTDNERLATPSSPASPSNTSNRNYDGLGRPVSPPGKNGVARPESASSWTTPRLMRSRSNNQVVASLEPQERQDESAQQTGVDPLSHHIHKRTNTPLILPSHSRPATADSTAIKDDRTPNENGSMPPPGPPLAAKRTHSSEHAAHAQKELHKGVKAVSFISKLMGNKKKEAEEQLPDNDSVSNDGRPEGNDAEVFAERVDNIGYNPRQPQPPGYIKVRAKHKKRHEFDRVFLAQELEGHKRRKVERMNSGANKLRRKNSAPPGEADTVWAMEFSKDGKYLAAAGVDGVVRVWKVLASSNDRQKHEQQEANESEEKGKHAHAEHLSAPVFQSQPVREYDGHTSTVLDLSWSKNNFLLSSSMDKTVRLWHVSRPECLCTFKHSDFVPSIAFHPKDDRFFLAGSLDSKLRLWSIPDKNVAFTTQVPDMITAVAFTPDGKYAMAGCLSGLCMFYETEGMKYQSQIHVRSTRGQNAKGSKITGLKAYNDVRGDVKLLVTSNDSRIRLYNFRDKSLELKFRGNQNNCSQIRAAVSDDSKYVVCGSEDRKAYIWSLGQEDGEKRDKRPLEMFEAHNTITTTVCFAPAKTRYHLSKSEDPVYDLCNPPPVLLMSRAERTEGQSQTSSRPPTESGSTTTKTPTEAEGRFPDRPKESPAYLARSAHRDGNILVTADYTGRIKVFRQDCAWTKRQRPDDGDRASLFSNKRNGCTTSRAGSVITSKTSLRSLREGRTSFSSSVPSSAGPSDTILSWRQGVVSTPSIAEPQRRRSKPHSSRSTSPRKSLDAAKRRSIDRASTHSRTSQHPHPLAAGMTPLDTTSANNAPTTSNGRPTTAPATAPPAPNSTPQPPHTPPSPSNTSRDSPDALREITRSDDRNPLKIVDGGSYLFWDAAGWKARIAGRRKARTTTEWAGGGVPGSGDMSVPRTPLSPVSSRGEEMGEEEGGGYLGAEDAERPGFKGRGGSVVSRLSDEESARRSGEGEGEAGEVWEEAPEDVGAGIR